MEQCLVDVVLQLQQPFGIEEGHGPEQMDDCRRKVDQNRKTRQRDHRCHCGKNFQFSWSLKNHMESEHEGKDMCCTHCNKMFVNPVNLKKHLDQRICLGGSGRILTAPVEQVGPGSVGSDIGENVQDPWIIAEVQQNKKTPCPRCGKTFLRMGNLVKHMDKQICLKGSALPGIDKPHGMVTEEIVMEEMVMEEMVMEEMVMEENVLEEMVTEETVMEEMVMEEMVMGEMIMEENVLEEMVMEEIVTEEMVMEDSYCQIGLMQALTRPEVPMMRAEEGLHCFWEEDTGLEVLLVQVESGGKLFWAEPLKEAEFLRVAAGGLVMALEEEGFSNGEVLVEEGGVIALGRGLVSAMEEDDCLG